MTRVLAALLAPLLLGGASCQGRDRPTPEPAVNPPPPRPAEPARDWVAARATMVLTQLESRDIEDERVLAAMRAVPRHELVPAHLRAEAYDDFPLPIGEGQTISQPYIVALMSQLAHVEPGDTVLDVGTGSGYQAAVLAQMGATVYSIEIVPELGERARADLARLGYGRVEVRIGDGYRGWPEHAPFDAIVVAAAPPSVPEPLKQQLRVGGRLVLPVGRTYQELQVITRVSEQEFRTTQSIPVRFVPMTGEAQRR